MRERACEPGGAQLRGYYVCPVCAGRFDLSQRVPQLHLKNAPPRRWQRLAMCCPHCSAALRSRFSSRYAEPILFGLWLLLIVVSMATGLPDPHTKDAIQLALLGVWAGYTLLWILVRETSPHAFRRDTTFDPPAA